MYSINDIHQLKHIYSIHKVMNFKIPFDDSQRIDLIKKIKTSVV